MCYSPLFVSNIFRKYLDWLPGQQGPPKHKNLCCLSCIKVPTEPMSVSHYSYITALRGQLLCHSSTPYCTRYQTYGTVLRLFCTIYWSVVLVHSFNEYRPHRGWVRCVIPPFFFQTYSASIWIGHLA